MKRILVKNSIFGIAQAIINMLLVFFVIPIFIKMLGSESYGVFALVMVIGNLNTFTNLGLTSALTKFIAEQGRCNETNIDIVVNFILVLITLLPFTIIAIFFNKFILLDILKVPQSVFAVARGLYIWVVWANYLLIVGQVFKSILDALQKVYITSIQQAIYNIIYWSLILIVLLLGFNLPEIGAAIFFAALIWVLITFISAIKEWGKISFNGLNKGFKNSTKKQLSYGLKMYSSGLIGFFYEPLSKILISHFIGITEVGFYDLALRLRNQLWGFVGKIFYPLFPFMAEQKDKAVVRKYVHELEQKMFFLVVPLTAIIIVIMHPFIQLWIGKNINIIAITSIIIISFHLIGSSTVIPNYQFLMSKNLAEKTIILQFSNVVFNTLFFLITVSFAGYYALIIGNVAAILSSFILSLYYQKKYLDSLIFDSLEQVFNLIIILTILIILGIAIKLFLQGHNVIILLVEPIAIIFASMVLYKLFRLIRRNDINRYFGNNNKFSNTLVRFYNL